MKRRFWLLQSVAILAIVCWSNANALKMQPFKVGFITGNDYLLLDHPTRVYYATGFLDGMKTAPLFGATQTHIQPFENCTTGMTNFQIEAIISKYLNDNPGIRHKPLNAEVINAFLKACDIKP